MDTGPTPPWIIATTAFIALGICCAGLVLTGPAWIHLVPSWPTGSVTVPTLTPIPSATPTQYVVVIPTSRPTLIPTPEQRFAPIERPVSRPVIRSEEGNSATCLFTLIVLGGLVAVLYYFANKTGPPRSPAGVTLRQEIERYMKQGCQITHQTETTAQLTKPKQFDTLLAIILFFLFPVIGLIIYLLYFIGQRDTTLYLEVQGDRVITNKS